MDVFKIAQTYLSTGKYSSVEGIWFCEDRSQVRARSALWYKLFLKWSGNNDQAALMTAMLGELANNSFDHNLGLWTGAPGCLIGLSMEKKTILICVADRGQGIISSLRKHLPSKTTDHEVMRKAFEERISGRAPEHRGNGLKFVQNGIDGRGQKLFCASGNTFYKKGTSAYNFILQGFKNSPGTFSAIEWNLP